MARVELEAGRVGNLQVFHLLAVFSAAVSPKRVVEAGLRPGVGLELFSQADRDDRQALISSGARCTAGMPAARAFHKS